jgi:hypothetical protein
MYTRSRDKLQDAQQKRQSALEREKFEHQKAIEKLRMAVFRATPEP